MANYKHDATAKAAAAIRSMFALSHELEKEQARIKARYAPDIAYEKLQALNAQYKQSAEAAQQAVQAAVSAAHDRLEQEQAAMLTLGNAEEDYKLLALPVNLTPDELRVMAKRNENNPLFKRAVAKYAEDHHYDAADLRSYASGVSPKEQHRLIDEMGSQLTTYCEETRLNSVITHDWREAAFAACENRGLFDNL